MSEPIDPGTPITDQDIGRVERMWNGYRQACVHPNAGPVQLKETKNDFYAGCVALYTEIMSMLDTGKEATEGDFRRMQLIDEELKAFSRSIGAQI